ncbi:MAG: RNA methyltransferase [Bacteroidia bacterium]
MQKLSMDELNRKSPEEFRESEKTPLIILLDNVRSLNNVGSVFRTADAFLIHSILLCGYTGTPPHRDIQKTALGATETVAWHYEADILVAIEKLKQEGWEIWAVEQASNSVKLDTFALAGDKKYALVFGNEVEGVQQSVIDCCAGCIEIPQLGMKHSLNISVSAGIVIWELWKQLGNKPRT